MSLTMLRHKGITVQAQMKDILKAEHPKKLIDLILNLFVKSYQKLFKFRFQTKILLVQF